MNPVGLLGIPIIYQDHEGRVFELNGQVAQTNGLIRLPNGMYEGQILFVHPPPKPVMKDSLQVEETKINNNRKTESPILIPTPIVKQK